MAVKSRMLEELLSEEYEFELPVSMIDVVFLLLIFFLCASKFRKSEQKMDINLPKDTGIRPIPTKVIPPREIKLKVDKQGKFTLDAVEVRVHDLVDKLRKIAKTNTDVNVVIIGEHKTLFRWIVVALDSCMRAGIEDVKFQGLDVRGLGRPIDAPPK